MIFLAAALFLYINLQTWPDTPDGAFHIQRTRALAEALRWGVVYPRWFPDFAFGYGYPVFHYYAPLSYYPAALLHGSGLALVESVRAGTAFWHGLSGAGMALLLAKRLGLAPALIGALLYLVAPYRLYDLYVRGALPEFAAFAWLPLIVHFTLAATRDDKLRGGITAAAALCWTGLILTHNLTAMMAALGGAIALIALLFTERGVRRGLLAVVPFVLGSALSAPYALPALWESRWVGIGGGPSYSFGNHFAEWRVLLDASFPFHYANAAEPVVPLPAYTAVIVAAAGVVALLPVGRALRLPVGAATLVVVAAVWLSSAWSRGVWMVAAGWLGKLQFPWRWQMLVAFGVAALAALAISWRDESSRTPSRAAVSRAAVWVIAGVMIVYAFAHAWMALPRSVMPALHPGLEREQMWAFDAEHGQVGATWTAEMLPVWVTEQRWAIGREPSEELESTDTEAVPFRAVVAEHSYLDTTYTIQAEDAFTLILDRFYFPAWRVAVDGAAVETFPITTLGLLAAHVPNGTHSVAVQWAATPGVRAGWVAAAGAWLAMLALLIRARQRGFVRVWLAAAIGAGALALLPVRTVEPMSLYADFGAVALSGAEIAENGVTGNVARLRLYWSVQEPVEPLTAFVHVLGEDGQVVAQLDAPLGGNYRPATRLVPGMIAATEFAVPLPDGLAPGSYPVKAGVYRPGAANAPLVAADHTDARIDIGMLEVRR